MSDTPEAHFEKLGGTTEKRGKVVPLSTVPHNDHCGGTRGNGGLLSFICPTKLQGLPLPERQWLVDDWLPVGHVTLDYGDGGVGKTLLAQQLMTSCATGKPWCGLAVTPCRVLGLFCEDDDDELHRRQDRINAAYGVDFDALNQMHWASAVGQDNALIRFGGDGRGEITDKLLEIEKAAKAHGARLIVIDTAADTFGGNENDRAQVRQFIGHALNGLAREIGGAVLLNAHPSRSGMSATGDLDGGSTAWSNTARSRWSLARAGGDDADPDERILTRRKANYAAIGETIRLRWQNGVLVPVQAAAGLNALAARARADAVFLELLAASLKDGRHVSDSSRAGNYAPKEFSKRANRQGLTQRDFDGAMERLFAAGKILTVEYGRPSKAGRPRHIEPAVEAP